jgi:hypothetical protein
MMRGKLIGNTLLHQFTGNSGLEPVIFLPLEKINNFFGQTIQAISKRIKKIWLRIKILNFF